MLKATVRRIDDFTRRYIQSRQQPDEQVLADASKMSRELQRLLGASWLSEVSDYSASKSMSLVFGMAPGYRELYKYYLMLQNGISVGGDIFHMSVRDTPQLYEYTNYFLLSNSSTYSELLLKSEADYRFFTELKRRTNEAVIEQSDEATAFEFGSAKVLFDRSNICVFVGDKQVDMCTVQEFSKHPNATFRRLQKYAELMITS